MLASSLTSCTSVSPWSCCELNGPWRKSFRICFVITEQQVLSESIFQTQRHKRWSVGLRRISVVHSRVECDKVPGRGGNQVLGGSE